MVDLQKGDVVKVVTLEKYGSPPNFERDETMRYGTVIKVNDRENSFTFRRGTGHDLGDAKIVADLDEGVIRTKLYSGGGDADYSEEELVRWSKEEPL